MIIEMTKKISSVFSPLANSNWSCAKPQFKCSQQKLNSFKNKAKAKNRTSKDSDENGWPGQGANYEPGQLVAKSFAINGDWYSLKHLYYSVCLNCLIFN